MEKDLEIEIDPKSFREIEYRNIGMNYNYMSVKKLVEFFFIQKLKFKLEDYPKVIVDVKDNEVDISIPINETEYKVLNIPYTDNNTFVDALYLSTLNLKF